jgi:hypothetical protein
MVSSSQNMIIYNQSMLRSERYLIGVRKITFTQVTSHLILT